MLIKLHTREVEVRSLTLGDVIKFTEDGTLAKIPTSGTARVAMLAADAGPYRAAMVKAIGAATGLKPDEVNAELDLENVEAVIAAIMAESRLLAKGNEAGEAVPQIP